MADSNPQSTTSSTFSGGTLQVQLSGAIRRMIAYTVTKTELSSFSAWSSVSNKATTTAFSLWSFAIGLFVQALFSDFDKISPVAKAIVYLGCPLSAVLGLVAFLIGRQLTNASGNLESMIKAETQHAAENNE